MDIDLLTRDIIEAERKQLQKVSNDLPPLTEFFKQSAVSIPLSAASYDNDAQKLAAQQEIKSTLMKLSDERADIIFEEIGISLRLSGTALSRVHLLLHHRPAIYEDGDAERCSRDIMLHQNQSGFHIERAAGILPTALSHSIKGTQKGNHAAEIDAAMLQYKKSLKDIEDQANGLNIDSAEKNPDDAMARELYAQLAYDLGQLNRAVIETASQRIRNALAYVELINVGLIPYDMGNEKDWSEQKILLLQESLNSFNTFLDHINGAGGYLAQAESYIEN